MSVEDEWSGAIERSLQRNTERRLVQSFVKRTRVVIRISYTNTVSSRTIFVWFPIIGTFGNPNFVKEC